MPNDTNFFWATFFILYDPLEISTGACPTPSGTEIVKTHHCVLWFWMLCCDPPLICKWDANVEPWKNNFKEAWGCFEVSSKGQTIKCKSQGEQSTTPKLPHLMWRVNDFQMMKFNVVLWYHQSNISQVLHTMNDEWMNFLFVLVSEKMAV